MAIARIRLAPAGRSKYGATRTRVDGITFHSKAEARRYVELKLLQQAGEITDLALQPVYPLDVAGLRVGRYVADFAYYKPDGELAVEDVKGFKTPMYRWKKRHVAAQYGIQITEVR